MIHVTAIEFGGGFSALPPVGKAASGAHLPATVGGPVDTVDLTGMTVGDAITELAEACLEGIRRRIAAGTYLTDDKLAVVAERICRILRAPGEMGRISA
ncbi:MAG: hypothetical protein KAY37_00740 [Phycisphaerae bacterium]|nr:hypothetical protein [Phycisphaerae bacterium]